MVALSKTIVRGDDALRDKAIIELKWEPEVTSRNIAVVVRDGIVTLSGNASSYYEKEAAEQAAKRVYGVRGVANDIEVKLATQRTDPEIARDTVHKLDRHLSIPRDTITITVKNGWVTLEGTVDWQYQKTLAEPAVKKLRGVVGVIDNIQLRP